MKLFVVLAAAIAACSGGALPPSVPGDNSHYVEGVSRYIWMPDGEGVDHLVDLQAPVDESVIAPFNGANNQYRLFTRRNPNSAQVITNGNVNSIRNSNYMSNRPLKVIVHGWNSDGNSAVNTMVRDAFLAVQDCNVIVVDWRSSASGLYNAAVLRVPSVGEHLGNFIQWLINNGGGNWNNVHFVGFSLGAHVVGLASRQVGRRAARITGLDPAGPQWGGNSRALNRNDATYVECIHTDGRALGIMDPSGDTDFYPNGGRYRQPGCATNSCGHSLAYQLFASSVRTDRFTARRCNNLNEAQRVNCNGATLNMGNGNINKRGTGLYALNTGGSWPF